MKSLHPMRFHLTRLMAPAQLQRFGKCLPGKYGSRDSRSGIKALKKALLHHWAKNGKPTFISRLYSLAKKHKFSVDKPVKDLPEKALNIILYGKEDGTAIWKFRATTKPCPATCTPPNIEGIINMLETVVFGQQQRIVKRLGGEIYDA